MTSIVDRQWLSKDANALEVLIKVSNIEDCFLRSDTQSNSIDTILHPIIPSTYVEMTLGVWSKSWI